MKRYILTGTPGSGKTSLLQALELTGSAVVSEAASDLIALRQKQGHLTPWKQAHFIDDIINLQRQRQIDNSKAQHKLQFYDRSPICTYALARYLKINPSDKLLKEIERIQKYLIYEKSIFFIENLGFITNTAARQISFEDSLIFEQIHKEVYAQFGYHCIAIPAKSIEERLQIILKSLKSQNNLHLANK